MKKNILTIISILILLSSIYLVLAVANSNQMKYKTCIKDNNDNVKTCYITARNNYKSCINEAKNNINLTKIEKRDAYKNCINSYKSDRNLCRTADKENHFMCKQHKCKENEPFVDGKCMEVVQIVEINKDTTNEENNESGNNTNNPYKQINDGEIRASTEYPIHLKDGSFFVYNDNNRTSGSHITNKGMVSETSTHYINVHEIVMEQCTKAPSGNMLCLESMVSISLNESNIGSYKTEENDKGTKIIKEIVIIGILDS